MSIDFAIIIPVAGKPREVFRLNLLIASIHRHESVVPWIVIINDSLVDTLSESLISCSGDSKIVVLTSPRLGFGFGGLGGLCTGVMHGLSWIFANTSASFVLKLDVDAFVLSVFSQRIAHIFACQTMVGQIGVIGRTCNRTDPTFGFESQIVSPLIRILDSFAHGEDVYGHVLPQMGVGLSDSHKNWRADFNRIRHHIVRALDHNYCTLSYCQGGAYAVSREMLMRLSAAGCFSDYLSWSSLPIGEDVIVGMLTNSVGLELLDHSEEHQLFGLHWRGLPFDPPRTRDKGFAIIHSLRQDSEEQENALYSFFTST